MKSRLIRDFFILVLIINMPVNIFIISISVMIFYLLEKSNYF